MSTIDPAKYQGFLAPDVSARTRIRFAGYRIKRGETFIDIESGVKLSDTENALYNKIVSSKFQLGYDLQILLDKSKTFVTEEVTDNDASDALKHLVKELKFEADKTETKLVNKTPKLVLSDATGKRVSDITSWVMLRGKVSNTDLKKVITADLEIYGGSNTEDLEKGADLILDEVKFKEGDIEIIGLFGWMNYDPPFKEQ